MQVVILAAGAGTRLRPLTNNTPKPLIKVNHKPLLEYNLDKLPNEIDEIIIVINYLGDKIKDYFQDEFQGRKITYIKQEERLGTGQALKICQKYLSDKFLVLMGDDIYSELDMEKCLAWDNCMLVSQLTGNFSGGKVETNEFGLLKDIVEGDHSQGKFLVNTGLYVLNQDFFDYDLVKLKNKPEYGLPQTLTKLAQDKPVQVHLASFWHQINTLEDLASFKKLVSKIKL